MTTILSSETTISGSRTMNNESKVSLYIHDIFGTPKEKFEFYMLPSLQAYGTVSRFDYAVAHREDGSERVMAFIHFRDVDENSFALKKLREEFTKTGYSDCYVLPGRRYFRIRENKTPISETTMNLDQVADCAIKSAEQIEEHVKCFSEFVTKTNYELKEIKETVKDNYDDFQLNDAFMRNLMNKRHLAFEEHVKRFNNLDSVLSEFVLDTNSAITKQSSEILHIKEKYMDCNQTVDSIRNENDWLHSQIHITMSQFHLKLDMRDSVIDKQVTQLAQQANQIAEQSTQIAEQSTQIAEQNERFSDMEKMHDSMNRIIDKMLENSEKMSNRIKVLEYERKYGH